MALHRPGRVSAPGAVLPATRWPVLALTDPKTARSQRTLPLPGFCVQALKEHQDRQGKEQTDAQAWPNGWDLVFTTQVGTPIEPRNLNRHFDALIRRAGLPRVRFHDLRHTRASLLLAEGEDPRVIMDTLGHSVIGTTLNLYTHVMPATQRAAANRMNNLLRPDDEAGGSSIGSSSAD